MTSRVPDAPGPAVARRGRGAEPVSGYATTLLEPFLAGRARGSRTIPEAPPHPVGPQTPATPAVADSMKEVADRLERIVESLRTTSPAGMLARESDGKDALELLITAFALGYHEGRVRATPVDPAPRSA